ncbi:MAG: stage II sporulation protein R [Clostridia bacterium]|nr:stage II sporulation protein R [Clostridia bacterium]
MDKLLTLALCIALIFMLIGVLPVHGEEAIYDSVIRLHVLANSDSEADQEEKLSVRDAVLAYTKKLLKGCETREDAMREINAHIGDIETVAKERLAADGCTAPVTVTFGVESYPTRQYESCCFPSGDYLSLRVLIGSAEGQNWWCVLFPSLCLSAATEDGDASVGSSLASLGLSGDQYRIITDSEENTTYRVRFKLLEVLEEIAG